MLATASYVWALPDNVTPLEVTGSQVIKATGGFVYSINVNYAGVTAGDKVQILDGGSGGTSRLTCTASGTNGNCSIYLTVGAAFPTGIFYKETKTGGAFTTDIQYF